MVEPAPEWRQQLVEAFAPTDTEEGPTSDTDRELLPELTPPMFRKYEDAIRRILEERVPGHIRVEGTHLPGEKSEIDRQIDVLLKAPHFDNLESTIVVECKRYKRRVGVGTVDELIGKLLDVGAEHGVLCAPNGFTPSARQRAANARHPRVHLYDLSGDEEFNVDDLPGPDCPQWGCEWGHVSWGEGVTESGDLIGMGRCDSCGSLAVRCEGCGSEMAPDGLEECTCGFTFDVVAWRPDEDGDVVRTRVADGHEDEFDWKTS